MKECYKPKTSDEIQKASEEYIWKTHIDNASVQDHFIAGAEWMQERMIEKAEKWLCKYFVEDHYGMSPAGFGVFFHMFKQAMQDESKRLDQGRG